MRILLLTSVDINVKSGGGFANRAFYDSLTMHYPDCVDVISCDTCKGSKLRAIMHGKIHRLSWLLDYLDHHQGVYQVCVINTGLFGDLVPEIEKRGIRVVTIHHNYEAVFQMGNKQAATLWGLTPFFVKRNERKAYLYSDLNVFLSGYDRQMMQAGYGTTNSQNDVVVGVYETIEHSKATFDVGRHEVQSQDVAISGRLDHLQTELGMKDFKDHYYRLLRQVMPTASRLIVTGRDPRRSIVEFAKKEDVELVSSPSSISDVIKDCSIYLCPVNVGSGVKLRILDGLRLGMPILTHEVSARGYEVFADQPWFKAYHDAASFEDGLRTILDFINQHDDFRHEIISEYKSHFSFEAGDQRFIDALSRLTRGLS